MTSRRSIDELAGDLLGKTVAELAIEERNVLQSIYDRTVVSADASDKADAAMTMGDRLADRVAAVGGSWAFISSFVIILLGWMLLNSRILGKFDEAFDPFPFIFLNLMLSTLAAIQAPIIMMSQNRASAKDRVAAAHDFEVNLRAEIDIIRLHEKMDDLMLRRITDLEKQLADIRSALPPAAEG